MYNDRLAHCAYNHTHNLMLQLISPLGWIFYGLVAQPETKKDSKKFSGLRRPAHPRGKTVATLGVKVHKCSIEALISNSNDLDSLSHLCALEQTIYTRVYA